MSEHTSLKDDIDTGKGRVADAVRGHWADTLLPLWFRPYARLSRLERPHWLVAASLALPLVSHLAVATHPNADLPSLGAILWYGVAFWLGAVAMRGAGCTYNDLVDHKIDEKVERTRSRPLPSNQVTRFKAWIWLGLQLLIGLVVLLQFNLYTIILGFASLSVVAIYPFMKRITHWPQLVLGLAFSWGALVGWSSITGALDAAPLLMYIACVVWTIGYDTIYAHQDKEDDVMIGVKSTALLFAENTKRWLTLFYGVMVALMAVSFGLAGVSWPAFAALTLVIVHMGWQIHILDINNSDQCLSLFRSNTQIGWILFAGLLVSIWL